MLKTAFLTLLTLVIAIGGGTASLWYVLRAQDGVGAVTIGGWTAFPDIGTPNADPYSKARVAREGILSLGRAEGLAFAVERDADGALLRRECSYRIEGSTPPARFWTLYAADGAGRAIKAVDGRESALHSLELLRQPDNSFVIAVSSRPAPGNWLTVSGSGAMRLVLTLYDTPIADSTGIAEVELPLVVEAGCDG
ncbi:DUF1214 domain-containing protein [Mesorhizobium sp. WSM2239]|uniref:DUF1214 domain-containing protein n=2 Tax=unclassified Mesorhizobium TaxID=325217 RepID=A0AAU8D4A4_9HYPH